MKKDKLLLSIIVASRNRKALLNKCLQALRKQTLSQKYYEIIIVDNGSTDQTKQMVEQMRFSSRRLKYVYFAEQNTSLARNLGARMALGTWLVFTDSDCLPFPDWLENIHAICRKKNRIHLFGGPVIDFIPSGTRVPYNFRPEGWDQTYGHKERFLASNEPLTECNLVIRKKTFLQVGEFRWDLGPGNKRFGFHEGTELQARIRREIGGAGFGFYSPSLAMRHVIRPGRVNFWARLWRTFISGYDFARAFPQENKTFTGSFLQVLIRGLTFLALLPINMEHAQRNLFRLGESAGEAFRRTMWLNTHRLEVTNPRMSSRQQGNKTVKTKGPKGRTDL